MFFSSQVVVSTFLLLIHFIWTQTKKKSISWSKFAFNFWHSTWFLPFAYANSCSPLLAFSGNCALYTVTQEWDVGSMSWKCFATFPVTVFKSTEFISKHTCLGAGQQRWGKRRTQQGPCAWFSNLGIISFPLETKPTLWTRLTLISENFQSTECNGW